MNDNFPPIISMNEAARLTSLSRTAINRLRAAGDFPAPVELGERRIGFVRAEIVAWIEARIATRRRAA